MSRGRTSSPSRGSYGSSRAGGVSRQGPASSGALGSRPSTRPATPSTRPAEPSTRPTTPTTRPTTPSTRPSTGAQPAAPGTRPSQRPEESLDRPSQQPDREGQRDEAREDWQQHQNQNREDWQNYNDEHYEEHGYGYGYGHPYGYGYPYGGTVIAIGVTLAPSDVDKMECTMTKTVVGSETYYRCANDWYQRIYENGDVAYVVVAAPKQ